jgi:crotonobetainyl-CoA:carnitine CoA-transferase CaiB-like acyl-CoA transferase
MGGAVVAAANGIAEIGPRGNTDERHVPHDAYPCAGGNDDWCVISVRDDAEWAALVRTMGLPAAAEARFATEAGRRAARAAVDGLVAGWTRGLSAHEVMDRCQAAGVPAGVVATGRDLAMDPHFEERGFLVEMEHAMLGRVRLPGPAMRLGHDRLEVWRLGPLMGEDNDYVLGEILGRHPEEIARLQAEGVVT